MLVLIAAAPSLLGGAGGHPDEEVPRDVLDWFEHADRLIMEIQEDSVTIDIGSVPSEYADVSVAEPRWLYAWTTEFLTEESSEEVVVQIEQWAAPFSDRDDPAGTIHAYRNASGTVDLAYFDDNSALSEALQGAGESGLIVWDAPLDLVVALEGETVLPLSDGAARGLTGPMSVDEFRDFLIQQYREMGFTEHIEPGRTAAEDAENSPGAQSSTWPWFVMGGMALVLVTSAVAIARFSRSRACVKRRDVTIEGRRTGAE